MEYTDQEIWDLVHYCVDSGDVFGKASIFHDALEDALHWVSDEKIEKMKDYLKGRWVKMDPDYVDQMDKLKIIGTYTKYIF